MQYGGGEGARSALLAVSPVLPGAASAVSLVAVGYPFDTVKTRLQLQMHPSMVHCFRNVAAKDGLLSLYRGASMAWAQHSCRLPVELAVFEWFTHRFQGTWGASYAGGLLGGFASTLLVSPLSVIKVQMQMVPKKYNSPPAAALAIWRAQGIKGFYRGFHTSLCVQVPYSTLFLGTYGLLRDAMPQGVLSPMLAGGLASIMTWTVLQPFDTLRTVSMSQATATAAHNSTDRSLTSLLRRSMETCGPRGLWRGFAPVAVRALPSSGCSMLAYEGTKAMVSGLR